MPQNNIICAVPVGEKLVCTASIYKLLAKHISTFAATLITNNVPNEAFGLCYNGDESLLVLYCGRFIPCCLKWCNERCTPACPFVRRGRRDGVTLVATYVNYLDRHDVDRGINLFKAGNECCSCNAIQDPAGDACRKLRDQRQALVILIDYGGLLLGKLASFNGLSRTIFCWYTNQLLHHVGASTSDAIFEQYIPKKISYTHLLPLSRSGTICA